MIHCTPTPKILAATFALLVSSFAANGAIVSAEAIDNATVQTGGPRSGNNGKNFFNVQGSSTSFPSFGVADFSASSFGLTSSVTDIVGDLSFKLTQSLTASAATGPLNFYLTELTTTSIQSGGGLIYDSTALEEGLGTQLDPKYLLGAGVFTRATTGTVDTYTLTLSTAAESYFISQLNNASGILRLVITPTAATTVAQWAGFSNSASGPTLTFDTALDPTGQYWDPSGVSTGIGGAGTWDTGTPRFNPNSNGTAALQVHDPAIRKVFGGTAGNVQVAAGVTQTAVIEFLTAGYELLSGPLVIGPGAIVVSHAANASSTISALISGGNGLTKAGPGSLVLSGANTFTGAVTIQEGTLRISTDGNLGNVSNDIVLTGGRLQTSATIVLDVNRDLSGTGGLDLPAGTSLTVGGSTSFGTITFSNVGNFVPSGSINVVDGINTTNPSGTVTIASPLNFPLGTHVINVADGTAAVDAIVSGDITLAGSFGTDRLHKVGSGTLELSGVSNAAMNGVRLGTAGDSPVDGGRLRITNSNSLGRAELQFNAGVLHAVNPLTGSDALPIGISVGAGTANPATFEGSPMEFTGSVSLFLAAGGTYQHQITVNTAVTFAGGLNGSTGNSLKIAGTGSLLLSNSSNGLILPTVVDGPRVTINGSLGTALSLKAGTLAGNALLTGDVLMGDSVGDDAVFSPGDGLGNVELITLTFGTDATLQLEIDRALGIADQIVATGPVALGSGTAAFRLLELTAGPLPLGTAFTILNNIGTDATTGFFEGRPDLAPFAIGPNTYQLDYNTGSDLNDIVLRVIPEPSCIALLALGIAASAIVRRHPNR